MTAAELSGCRSDRLIVRFEHTRPEGGVIEVRCDAVPRRGFVGIESAPPADELEWRNPSTLRLPAARTLLPVRIAASAAGCTPTSPGPSYARLSKALASRRGPMLLVPPSSGSRCRVRLLGCWRCRIQLAVSLLDPPRTEMALHCDADVVRAVVGARQVKFLSSPAGSQSQDALAQARCAGFACR